MIMHYFMEYFKFWLSNLTFAALSQTFGGQEASLFHAFRVISYCDLERDVPQFLCWQLLLF